MTINKGLKSLVESSPNFSNQALENAINDIKSIDNDDGYLFILSQFTMDTAIHDNTVLSQTQKNDALETLYNAQPHLQIGRYLSDVIRHTNTILDGTIVALVDPDQNVSADYLEILQTVHSIQDTIPELYGVPASEKSRSVNDHMGSLNNIFSETEDSSKPVFTRLKETLQLIENKSRTTTLLAIGTAAVAYSNYQVRTFLTTITDDSTDYQTSLDNRINTAAGNMANLNTQITNALGADVISELQAIREEINTQVNLENSNLSGIRTYVETLSDNQAFVSCLDNPDLRKVMLNTAQNTNWRTYFNDYETNKALLNPIYTTDTDSDKSALIDQVLKDSGLPDVTDPTDLEAVAEKAKKDDRINTRNYDRFTVEIQITKSCEQLGLVTANRSIIDQSTRLLSNMNQNDRDKIVLSLDLNEDVDTLS